MGRLFAYLGNDPERVRCALHPVKAQLQAPVTTADRFDSWGIGFYQGGEVLLQRRPKAPADSVDFFELSRDLRSDAIMGHLRAGTVGTPKNENTHPFRFRSWLFAHHGTIPQFEARVRDALLDSIPEFLRRNIRGQTDSEHLFHLVLAFLHDANKLDDGEAPIGAVTEAVRQSLRLVDKLVDGAPWEGALAVTNGQALVATRRGQPAYLWQSQAIQDCPVCREAGLAVSKSNRRVDHEHLRSVVYLAGVEDVPQSPWKEIPDQHLVSVSKDFKVEISQL